MRQKKVIVTGANGFTGKYLIRELTRNGIYVVGTWHHEKPSRPDECEWYRIDLQKFEDCKRLIDYTKPDAVIHLAAQNSVVKANEEPRRTICDNVLGTVNLLESVRKNGIKTRCILAGSAAVYDAVQSNICITEEMPLSYTNMYALTKYFQEQIALKYHTDYGMDIICTRPFNYTGYLQGEHCFIPSLCRQVCEIKKGKKKAVLTLGNLSVSRDFLDVRDVVCAYRLLLDTHVPCGIYNIASKRAVKLLDIVQYLCGKTGMEVKIVVNKDLVRKDDIAYICGDSGKIRKATGWEIKYSVFDTVEWIYTSMQGE